MTNEHAAALGRMAKGIKKTLTNKERKRRAQSLEVARKSRWAKKEGAT